MTFYYRDESVEVTRAGVRVHGHLYRFDELSRIWYRRGERSWAAVAGRGAWGLTLISPLVAAGLALVLALNLDVSPGTRAVIVLGAVLLGLGWRCSSTRFWTGSTPPSTAGSACTRS